MTLGEKLQRLRRQGGLSQEQLAEQLSVSRQAVSKWELDETMPDTENVVQLSRLFGVSCDYLLLDEVDERGAPIPAPGETRLSQRGWVHNAFALSLAVCAVGLLAAVGLTARFSYSGAAITGLAIQLGGILVFELAAPRMGERGRAVRLGFYMIANWLVLPIPAAGVCWWIFHYAVRPYPLLALAVYLSFDLLLCGGLTAALAVLRHKMRKAAGFGQNAG